jgi:diaminohydroxyphosphoribosylaminopyrimidine deaminase/5-amino-6-(5-phosphoribosylamino)uracil reductase
VTSESLKRLTDDGDILNDITHMKAALNLARRGLGNVWPNPAVGCVIVKNMRVVGRGWTKPGGRPHAETEALDHARELAIGATAYITLEPCNHHGKTPPCTDALIAAGVKRVVIASKDPDERVAGAGISRLESAGITVDVGVEQSEADDVNQGFFLKTECFRPRITLKIATTLDGKIASRTGVSKWITGDLARRKAHGIRAKHDAILIGSGTAIMDNPSLTCRLSGLNNERRIRIVLDGRLRLPMDGTLIKTAKSVPVMLFTSSGDDEKRKMIADIKDNGVSVHLVSQDENGLDIIKILNQIASMGLTRILVEGGGAVAKSFIKLDLVDEIAWFRAPTVFGNDGVPAIEELGLDKVSEMLTFSRQSHTILGEDTLEILYRER